MTRILRMIAATPFLAIGLPMVLIGTWLLGEDARLPDPRPHS